MLICLIWVIGKATDFKQLPTLSFGDCGDILSVCPWFSDMVTTMKVWFPYLRPRVVPRRFSGVSSVASRAVVRQTLRAIRGHLSVRHKRR